MLFLVYQQMENIIYFKEKTDAKICLFTVLYITSLLANLTVGFRYIRLFSLIQPGGIFIFPISFIISDILTELYGSELAKKLVYYGIMSQFILAAYANLIIHIPAPSFLLNQDMYFQVFNPYLKFAFASTTSILIGSWVNIVLLSKLSEYVGGKYFALRSFIASTFGELIVTLVSMFIGNYTRMNFSNLLFMIVCCFTVKTIISFVAIWPAALVVYKLQGQKGYDLSLRHMKNPFKFCKHMALAAWYAKGYVYQLESINLATQKANLYFKGARRVINLPLQKIVFNDHLINNSASTDSAHIGYYYGVLESKGEIDQSMLIERMQILKRGDLNITSICRDGKLTVEGRDSQILLSKKPIELYKNKLILEKFSPSQALYIGYLASISNHKGNIHSISKNHNIRIIK